MAAGCDKEEIEYKLKSTTEFLVSLYRYY